MKADGAVWGALFPATIGNAIGTLNDGTVFNPTDTNWLAGRLRVHRRPSRVAQNFICIGFRSPTRPS
jgi:hypothetical protein